MINSDRIVPIQKCDLISMYGLVLLQNSNNASLAKLAADDIGQFQVKTNSAVLLASEPVVTVDFDSTASSVSAGVVYFVAAHDYAGFTIDGAAVVTAGTAVVADGVTLWKATLSSSTITIAKVGF